MKKVSVKFMSCLVSMAFVMAAVSANWVCHFITYQPEEPEDVKKLRKF